MKHIGNLDFQAFKKAGPDNFPFFTGKKIINYFILEAIKKNDFLLRVNNPELMYP